MRAGFSLVELSIVLVILGLLTGGILAGQSLIRAAEMRSVSTEYSRWVTATQTFRDKYFAIPGDFRDATKFWDRNVTNGWCVSNSGKAGPVASGACDGNGDGMLYAAGAVSQSGEMFQFWRQLALAGLIEGTFSGIAGPGAAYAGGDTILGTNAPRSKMNNGGWMDQWIGVYGNTVIYQADYGNALIFGAQYAGSMPFNAVLKPEEAWNIDAKMDDGKPGVGRVLAAWWDTTGTPSCATSTTNTDYAGEYKLTNNSNACALYFPRALQ